MRIIGNRGNTARKVQAVASGALASGDTVIVNANGTVSVVGISAPSFGSAAVFEGAAAEYISATFDSNSNKVVIAYGDNGNSGYGTAVVGTVSGTSISFGTPAVFQSRNCDYCAATFDSNSNKVVIGYSDRLFNRRGFAVVGTVSGTNISFGTQVQFESGETFNVAATFDSVQNRVVFCFIDNNNGNKGTAIVGTVSGTGISFGTAVVFSTSNTFTGTYSSVFDSNSNKVVIVYTVGSNGTAIVGTVSGTGISFGTAVVFGTLPASYSALGYQSATFDSNLNKVVIAYSNSGNSNYGTAIVGTVSGTGISFGTPVVFESATPEYISATFDSNSNKVVISYSDAGNSDYGTIISGTVSGTDISFGSAAVFESASSIYISNTFDSNSNKVVTAYQDNGNSDYGTGIVFQDASTTLTAENYIGIASNGYATGQAATINAKGFIDDNQSSLTAGQSYYVQTNGDLGLTAADPSVFAGTAVSATKIIVKG